jgi:LacI family transcriptional regulator
MASSSSSRAAAAASSGPARISDLAQAAGVSSATVDRVLNGRAGVRPQTAERVLKAAAALGYLGEHEARTGMAQRPMNLVFLLPGGNNRYLRMLGDYVDGADEAWAPFPIKCRTQLVESFNPAELAARLLHHGQRCDGIAMMALEHPLVRDAVAALAERGVPVVTLISDLSNARRVAHIGIDNRAAGRTAGLLLGRFMGPAPRGKIAMIAGSLNYRAHEEREIGFLHLVEAQFPQLQVLGLREGQDESTRNYAQTRLLLEQHPDLAGIYSCGGGTDGIARAIHETRHERKILFIGHGLTPDTRALLIDGTLDALISQPPRALIANCIKVFCNVREKKDPLDRIQPIQFSIVLRENLP